MHEIFGSVKAGKMTGEEAIRCIDPGVKPGMEVFHPAYLQLCHAELSVDQIAAHKKYGFDKPGANAIEIHRAIARGDFDSGPLSTEQG